MKETLRDNGRPKIDEVKISDRAYSFLLVTYTPPRSQQSEKTESEGMQSDLILVESGEMSGLIKEAIREWRNHQRDSPISSLSMFKESLKFEYVNSDRDSEENGTSLESDLIGRHDFFHLLESSWVPELGNLVERINWKLRMQDRIRTEELAGIPCVAADFFVDGRYFIGNEKPWFKPIDGFVGLDSKQAHALMFIDLKKGLYENSSKRMSLLNFLDLFPRSEENTCKKPIRALFLGYGIYEIVLILESPGLVDLFESVEDIRNYFCIKSGKRRKAIARGTSTMVFMLRKSMLKYEDPPRFEDEEIDYSTIIATETGKDEEISNTILSWNKDLNIELFDRQGHFDLIASFRERKFSKACLTMVRIRNVEGVLSTSTIIKTRRKKHEC